MNETGHSPPTLADITMRALHSQLDAALAREKRLRQFIEDTSDAHYNYCAGSVSSACDCTAEQDRLNLTGDVEGPARAEAVVSSPQSDGRSAIGNTSEAAQELNSPAAACHPLSPTESDEERRRAAMLLPDDGTRKAAFAEIDNFPPDGDDREKPL